MNVAMVTTALTSRKEQKPPTEWNCDSTGMCARPLISAPTAATNASMAARPLICGIASSRRQRHESTYASSARKRAD